MQRKWLPRCLDCDVVFHSAAFVAVEKINEDLMFKINVQGTQSIVNAAPESGVNKLVHFSSIHAFKQQPTNEPLVERKPFVSIPVLLKRVLVFGPLLFDSSYGSALGSKTRGLLSTNGSFVGCCLNANTWKNVLICSLPDSIAALTIDLYLVQTIRTLNLH